MSTTLRKIQSFVRRSGRLTEGQKAGLNDFWPDFGIDLPKGLIDFDRLFKKTQLITLEIGFGNGDSLLEMAIAAPNQNFLGIEVYEAGVGRLINEAHKHQLTNLKSSKPMQSKYSSIILKTIVLRLFSCSFQTHGIRKNTTNVASCKQFS